jgi:hypothetical protein
MRRTCPPTPLSIAVLLGIAMLGPPGAVAQDGGLDGWRTNWEQRSIDLDELMRGGPPKDGIPAIDAPTFVSVGAARDWLAPQEPVILFVHKGVARAYPLQILTWHEIVNDEVGGVPVVVTFCPLCYSAIVFRRTLDGAVYTFGVSGLLRNSDLVMYDRQTESLWQQLTGEAIVGDLTGRTLEALPAQIVSFAQFAEAYPGGAVLSRDTGYRRDYGANPYAGYDDVDKRPFAYRGPYDERLPPMAKVVVVSRGGQDRAYPHRRTREERVIHDTVGGEPVVIFHADGAVSALDRARIEDAREIGSTGVFDPRIDGRRLRFRYHDGQFFDEEAGSAWDITGRALDGPMAGRRLTPLPHGNYFSFAWFAFRPETTIYPGR